MSPRLRSVFIKAAVVGLSAGPAVAVIRNLRTSATRSMAFVAALCVIAGQARAIDAISRFDTGVNGWTLEGPGLLEWSPTGGNQGGCLRVTRTGPGEVYLVAPPSFHGNWVSNQFNQYPGRLTLNYFLSSQSAAATRPVRYEASGPAGSVGNQAIYESLVWRGVWSMVAVYGWSSSPVFNEVTQLKIRVGLDPSLPVGETMLIDNVGFKTCNANCDRSTATPILNANDFQCFLNAFAAGDPYTDFDGMPIPSSKDFNAFLNSFAGGCSAP